MVNLVNVLVIVGAVDLIINCFFHLIQLKRYCQDEIRTSIINLADRIERMHREFTKGQRDAQAELHDSFQFIKRKFSEEECDENPKDGKRREKND